MVRYTLMLLQRYHLKQNDSGNTQGDYSNYTGNFINKQILTLLLLMRSINSNGISSVQVLLINHLLPSVFRQKFILVNTSNTASYNASAQRQMQVTVAASAIASTLLLVQVIKHAQTAVNSVAAAANSFVMILMNKYGWLFNKF